MYLTISNTELKTMSEILNVWKLDNEIINIGICINNYSSKKFYSMKQYIKNIHIW